MSKTIPDKIPDFTLTRKAKHNYITGTEVLRGKEIGQCSQIKVSLADGSVDFYPNHSVEEEAANLRRLYAREEKQVTNAVENKKAFEDRANLSRSGLYIVSASAVIAFLLLLMGVAAASFNNSFAELLISSNALAYLGAFSALTFVSSILMYNEDKERHQTLKDLEKCEMFLENKALINEYQKKPVILLNLSPVTKNHLRKVIETEPLNIHNLHALSYLALAKFIENIKDHIASMNPGYQYYDDTVFGGEDPQSKNGPRRLSFFPKKGGKKAC